MKVTVLYAYLGSLWKQEQRENVVNNMLLC